MDIDLMHGREGRQSDNRIRTGIPPHMHFVQESSTLKMQFFIAELDHAIGKAQKL